MITHAHNVTAQNDGQNPMEMEENGLIEIQLELPDRHHCKKT